VVPKSVAANWMREAEKWFPGSTVMVIGETYTKDKKTGELKGRADNAVERNRKFHDITQNSYDFILITQPAWNDLDLNPELKEKYASEDFWEKRKKSMGKEPSAKQLARQKDAHDAKVAGQDFRTRTDAIYFDKLGVDAVIADECFPGDTPILTDHGWERIGDIVDGQLERQVLSFNNSTAALEWKPIVRWLPIKRRKPLVRVRHELGHLTCTADHKIWTQRGYVEASRLQPDDHLFLVQGQMHSHEPQAVALPGLHAPLGDVRDVSDGVHLSCPTKQAATSILLDSVLGHLEGVSSGARGAAGGVVGAASWKISPGEAKPLRLGEDEDQQSDARSGRTGAGDAEDARPHIPSAGGQLEDHEAAGTSCGFAPSADGARDQDLPGEGQIRVTSAVLQSGLGQPGSHAGDRGGWTESQIAEVAISGRAKDCGVERARVDGVEILEFRGDDGDRAGGEGHSIVYDLEVADNHNFFAAGALVSNCHAYKNLFAARDRFGQAPKFLGGSTNSKRAANMRYKTNWLRDHNGGRNVYGLSATPTKNSPLEVYSMLSHIAPEAFERIGIRNSEDFLDRFCVFEDRNILSTTGRMERALCTVGFKNMGELREIMRRYIDRKTAEDVGLQLPKRDDRQHMVDISAEQKQVYADLRKLADDAKAAGKDATGEAHPYSIMSKMDKATLDLELLDPVKYAGSRSPKMLEAAASVAANLPEGGQIIFCDQIGAHQKFVDMLVEKGVPRAQIGVMNAQVAPTSAQRQNIAEAYRARKLRVVIGNSTMEEGVDGLQEGTTDIHHLNIPWTPATIQQRNGRGLRQGNTAEATRLHNYLGKGTFDGYRYQTITAKKSWQDLLWSGGDKVENLAFDGGMSHEEMLIALAEDPEAAREQLAANKGLEQAKMDAEAHTAAADSYTSYRTMKATLAKLDAKGLEKASGQRLAFKVDRLKTGLAANPYFKPKHALETDKPVMIQPQTGHAFEPGAAFSLSADGKYTPGHYVVEALHPVENLVQVRRYGETGRAAKLSMKLDDLAHGLSHVDHDAKAEEAHITAKTGEALAANASSMTKWEQLRALPSAAIAANREVISRVVKEGMRNHTFGGDLGYSSKVGVIGPDGAPKAIESFNTSKIADDHEPMLPIDEHRKMAFDAYAADERAKKFAQVPVTGRRGTHTGYESKLRYPGDSYSGETANRWGGLIENLWGPEGRAEAHRQFESGALADARRAPTLKEAIGHALPTSIKRVGSDYMPPSKSQWGRKALATLWAKAKATGALRTPLMDHVETRMTQPYGYSSQPVKTSVLSEDHFSDGRQYGSVLKQPVRSALAKLALAGGHHDMAAAMAVDGAQTPDEAMANVNALPDSEHKDKALEHLRTKHPHLAGEPSIAA
jgi:hypothetical protein